MKKGHLCCEKSGGFANWFPMAILIQATASVGTLIEFATVFRQTRRCLGLPAKCWGWLFDVCVATILDLGLVDLLHKHQVSSMVPLTTFQLLCLLLWILSIQILHRAPGSACRSQQDFVRTFIFKPLEKPKSMAGDVKVPASFTTECLTWHPSQQQSLLFGPCQSRPPRFCDHSHAELKWPHLGWLDSAWRCSSMVLSWCRGRAWPSTCGVGAAPTSSEIAKACSSVSNCFKLRLIGSISPSGPAGDQNPKSKISKSPSADQAPVEARDTHREVQWWHSARGHHSCAPTGSLWRCPRIRWWVVRREVGSHLEAERPELDQTGRQFTLEAASPSNSRHSPSPPKWNLCLHRWNWTSSMGLSLGSQVLQVSSCRAKSIEKCRGTWVQHGHVIALMTLEVQEGHMSIFQVSHSFGSSTFGACLLAGTGPFAAKCPGWPQRRQWRAAEARPRGSCCFMGDCEAPGQVCTWRVAQTDDGEIPPTQLQLWEAFASIEVGRIHSVIGLHILPWEVILMGVLSFSLIVCSLGIEGTVGFRVIIIPTIVCTIVILLGPLGFSVLILSSVLILGHVATLLEVPIAMEVLTQHQTR